MIILIMLITVPLSNPRSRESCVFPFNPPRPSIGGIQVWNSTWIDIRWQEITRDPNGIIYLVGSNRLGPSDVKVAAYSQSGTKLRNWTWNGGYDDAGYDIAAGPNESIYVCGETYNPALGDCALIVNFDLNGTQRWNRTWCGLPGGVMALAYGVEVDSNGDALITGMEDSSGSQDIFILKYSSNGTMIWNHTWGGSNSDAGYGISTDRNNSVYIAGFTSSFGGNGADAVIVKYAANGTQLWNITWDRSYNDIGYSIATDISGNIFLGGSCGNMYQDGFLAKFNSDGMEIWNRTWGGGYDDCGSSITVDVRGDAYLAGYTLNFEAGGEDAFLVKYNSNGMQLWNQTWGTLDNDEAYAIITDAEENVYLAGYTDLGGSNYDAFLVKFTHVAPILEIRAPLAGNAFNSDAPRFNVVITDTELNASWYAVNATETNHSFVQSQLTTVNRTDWNSLSDGMVLLRFWANNTQGDVGFADVLIQKDTSVPYFMWIVFITSIAIITSAIFGIILYTKKRRFLRKRRARASEWIKPTSPGETVVFISYKHDDSTRFRVPEIAAGIRDVGSIGKVMFSEKDVTDDFVKYMNESLGECHVLVLFCSPAATKSRWVQDEWRAAYARGIPTIPVFTDPADIPALLKAMNGVQFNPADLPGTINRLCDIIKKVTGISTKNDPGSTP